MFTCARRRHQSRGFDKTCGNSRTVPTSTPGNGDVAGAGGFEPPHGGIKIPCLTAWRRPIRPWPAFMAADIATGTRGFQPCWYPVYPHIRRSTTKVTPCPCGPTHLHARASPRRRSVAQPGSAPRSGRGGRRFKSCHSDHLHQGLLSPIPNKGDRYGDRDAALMGNSDIPRRRRCHATP